MKVGDGWGLDFMPDGRWVVAESEESGRLAWSALRSSMDDPLRLAPPETPFGALPVSAAFGFDVGLDGDTFLVLRPVPEAGPRLYLLQGWWATRP